MRLQVQRAQGSLPLGAVRGLGTLLGRLLFVLARSRRRVALINLRLAYPQWSEAERVALARRNFVYFAQAFLDRSWLWHAHPGLVRQRKATGRRRGADYVRIEPADALAWMARCPAGRFDLVLLDPPFEAALLQPALTLAHRLVADGGFDQVRDRCDYNDRPRFVTARRRTTVAGLPL